MQTLARTRTATLVTRILEQPELVALVQGLDPPVLRKLIEHVGLEDAGEIVSLATTAQLEAVFDEDLWRSEEPGQDETFDALRFGLWIEVLLEAGADVAVDKIAEMDEDLLALGLARHVLVIDVDAIAAEMTESRSSEHDMFEKALESCLYEELEEFRVIARDTRSWDAILTVLVGLDKNDHSLLRRLLERCCAATMDWVEDNGGLYEVLTSAEMLESDVAAEREERREREGFVAPSAAASFLRHARVAALGEIVGARAPDPITKAHFRAATVARNQPRPTPGVDAFLRELVDAGVLPEPTAIVPRLAGDRGAASSVVERAMIALRELDERAFAAQLVELAYLANVLVAASASALRPIDATHIALSVCGLGITHMLHATAPDADSAAVATLETEGLVKAFRVGWHLAGCESWTADELVEAGARAATMEAEARVRRHDPRVVARQRTTK